MDVILLFSMVIGLLLIGVPIAVALGLSSTLFLLIYSDSSLASVAGTLFEAFEGHFTLLAIPFFILASSFMTTGGVARRIIRFSIACVGHLPGGLAIAGVFACMLFAGEREAKAVIGYREAGTDQREHWALVISRPVLSESGEVALVVSILHDITERMLVEQRKDEFISMTSHELKTPVTSLKGYTSILQRRLAKRGESQELYFLSRMDAQLDKPARLSAP